MTEQNSYVAYVDLLGIGDASFEDAGIYHDQLRRFRLALCDTVDKCLENEDKVFAFSDCAFASSLSLERLGLYLRRLQCLLWEHGIFLKGAISAGKPLFYDFAALPRQSADIIAKRKKKLQGYWFSKEFIQPALLEKNLKGIAIQVDSSINDQEWREQNVVASGYFQSDSSKRPVVINDLIIPQSNLEKLNDVLKTYLFVSHISKRLSRYYVPLIVTWIKSHDFSKVKYDKKTGLMEKTPEPFRQLIFNPKIGSEITALKGGDLIFFSLLAKVAEECTEAPNVTERVFEFIARNKKLRTAAEYIPDDICPLRIRRMMIDKRIYYLFEPKKQNILYKRLG